MRRLLVILLGLAWLVQICQAADLRIQSKGQSLTIPYWPAETAQPLGGVIVLHCGHDQDDLFIQVIAQQLAQLNWSIASLACDQHEQLWSWQIPATLSALRQQRLHRLVLVYYGDQLHEPFQYFTQAQAKQISGLILLSAWQDQGKNLVLKSLRFPVMDVVGQFDYPAIMAQFQQRQAYFKQHRVKYTPMKIPGANHQFQYTRQMLVGYLHGWMSKLPIYYPQPLDPNFS
jgi:hypothetical protein